MEHVAQCMESAGAGRVATDGIGMWGDVLAALVEEVPGACCLAVQTGDGIWALRDRYGIRPFVIQESSRGVAIASESVAFGDDTGTIRDVEAGQVVFASGITARVESVRDYRAPDARHCVFEYLYFLHHKSVVNKLDVSHYRTRVGRDLHDQLTVSLPELVRRWREGDTVVCGVPTSGVVFGKGFAEHAGIPYEQVLNKRAEYPWRTFILETDDKRIQACERKYVMSSEGVDGKTLVLVDDSIVRGNTLTYLIKYIRAVASPREIHIISGSPPIKHPCMYGVDFPDIEELFANRVPVEDMPARLNVDSVTYLDVDRLPKLQGSICSACFTGDYPF